MSCYNDKLVTQATKVVRAAIDDLLGSSGRGAVVGVAPAGAGKSHAIATAVVAARKEKLRVAVATPTNEQAFKLVRDIADRMPRQTVTFVPASRIELPEWARAKNVEESNARLANGHSLLVGTLNKLGDAHARGDLQPVDVLLIDEAYQASAVHYYLVGDLARRHLLMGDSGQLAPFTTAPEGDRWRGLNEDPLLTAIELLRRNHPDTKIHKLPITWRLDPQAVEVVRAFYPNHPFEAAVLRGVRRLKLAPARGRRGHALEDRILEHARDHGWVYLELPSSAVLPADPETTTRIVRLIERLLDRSPAVGCERTPKAHPLLPHEFAVAVSHNDQKNQLRIALEGARLNRVKVDTANKLQGLTFEVVIAWHPLAGLTELDEFHLDPGRLCVMLTRHRHACIIVGRAGDREMVRGIPPATPAYVGWDSNPALEGWYVHEAVFAALEPHRIGAG